MFYLAWRNITRRLGSSVLTAFIAFMAVLALTASMIVVTSLEDGVRLSRERLGADIMVLPAGASGNASEVLFCAEPVNVYLPASAAEAVAATEGVAASTPQFFTQTVDQSCCSVVGVTRVVGIDATTDFVLAPWIVGGIEGAGGAGASAEVDDFGLGDDGILLGSAAPTIEGGQASILGSVFHVAGTLAPTGTSVDETIFMDIDAARTIAAASPYLKSVWGDADPFDAVSCLMVKAADGSDIDALCQALVDAVPGSVAVRTADMVSGASSQLAVVEAIAMAFLVVLVVLAALALAGRFSALAASRMRELGLLRTFGMGRGRVVGCFACEIGLVTLVAAVVAVVVACLVAGSVVGTFHSEFNMPGAAVPASAYGAAVAVGLLFAVALTAVALVQPVVQMLRRDPQETLTRGICDGAVDRAEGRGEGVSQRASRASAGRRVAGCGTGPYCGGDGRFGQGEVDAAQRDGRFAASRRGVGALSRHRSGAGLGRRDRRRAPPWHRLRLPKPVPVPGADGAREYGDGAAGRRAVG